MELQLTDDKREFIKKNIEAGMSSTAISRGFQRRFRTVLRPQDIENMKVSILTPVVRRADVQEIKNKLGDHNQQLETVRAMLFSRMEDPDITNNDLVNLARELRSNISTSQNIASMNDEKGDVQFVLMYGDTIEKTSPGADITDVEFTVE